MKDYTKVFPYLITPTKTPRIHDFLPYGDFVKNEKVLVANTLLKYKSIHVEASSRGIGNKWVVIDCN